MAGQSRNQCAEVMWKLPGDNADLRRISELRKELLAVVPGESKARTSATPILATTFRMVGGEQGALEN
jgi:hypothetical protein